MEIIWTEQAKITYFEVLDYLNENWSRKELIQFTRRTEIVLSALQQNPNIFPDSENRQRIKRAVIDKNNSCFYMIGRYALFLPAPISNKT